MTRHASSSSRRQNPESDDFDPDEPASGYCIVNEAHIPVYQGLSEIRLADQTLHLTLTAEAAQSWRLRSTRTKVALRLASATQSG